MLFNTLIRHIATDGDVKVKAKKDRVSFAYTGPVTYDGKNWDGMILKVYTGANDVFVKFTVLDLDMLITPDYTPVSMEVIVPISGLEGFLMGILGLVEPKHAAPVVNPWTEAVEETQRAQADLAERETAERIKNYARALGVVVPLEIATEVVRAAQNAGDYRNAQDAVREIADRIGVYPNTAQIDHVLRWIL